MGEFVLAAEEFTPPGVGTFIYPPIFGEVTKPIVQALLAAVLLSVLFVLASRPPASGSSATSRGWTPTT